MRALGQRAGRKPRSGSNKSIKKFQINIELCSFSYWKKYYAKIKQTGRKQTYPQLNPTLQLIITKTKPWKQDYQTCHSKWKKHKYINPNCCSLSLLNGMYGHGERFWHWQKCCVYCRLCCFSFLHLLANKSDLCKESVFTGLTLLLHDCCNSLWHAGYQPLGQILTDEDPLAAPL